jgi:hypothetical protein
LNIIKIIKILKFLLSSSFFFLLSFLLFFNVVIKIQIRIMRTKISQISKLFWHYTMFSIIAGSQQQQVYQIRSQIFLASSLFCNRLHELSFQKIHIKIVCWFSLFMLILRLFFCSCWFRFQTFKLIFPSFQFGMAMHSLALSDEEWISNWQVCSFMLISFSNFQTHYFFSVWNGIKFSWFVLTN